jgi:hypothetical protein
MRVPASTALPGGDGHVAAETIDGGRLNVVRGPDLANDVVSRSQARQRVGAGGAGHGSRVAGNEVADVAEVQVDLDACKTGLAVVLDAVAVGVVEDGAGDGGSRGGGGLVTKVLSGEGLSRGNGHVAAQAAAWGRLDEA